MELAENVGGDKIDELNGGMFEIVSGTPLQNGFLAGQQGVPSLNIQVMIPISPPKRKRGRPSGSFTTNRLLQNGTIVKRGRPRKQSAPTSVFQLLQDQSRTSPKKKRGRPRKHPLVPLLGIIKFK